MIETLESKALSELLNYNGTNDFILELKRRAQINNKFYLTRSQSEYILNYHNVTPKIAKKWVNLDSYFAKKIAEDKVYPEPPKRIWVEKLLVDKEKSYHLWGKFFESESIRDIWVPKGALLKDNSIKNISVDYSKYDNRPPFEYQKIAIQKLLENKKFILSDDMGLGKTTSTIIAALETGVKSILIVCPASLKLNWKREIENYTDRSIFVCEGKTFDSGNDFTIINYDIIKNFHSIDNDQESILIKENFDLIILDESHYLKNPQAIRTKLINDLCKKTDRLWLLTGTPITSRPIDYYNLLSLVESPVTLNWKAYVIRYCAGYQFNAGGRKIWNVNGASNLEELRDRTSSSILRRLKEDVLDLPEKIITPIYLKLNSKEYESLVGEYVEWRDSNKNENKSLNVHINKLMKIRQLIADEKIANTIELAENAIDQGKKVIIFCNFTESLNKIKDHFGKSAVKLDGSTSQVNRQLSVDEFQTNEKVKVFVGNIKAAGTGITLTKGEVIIFNDLSFVPSDHSQAEDRAYRYGQKNTVSVFYPIFVNTVESIIFDMINRKKKVIATVMGDEIDLDNDSYLSFFNQIS